MLTKLDIKALRTADALCVHLNPDRTLVRAIKHKDAGRDPFAHDIEHLVTATVGLETMRGREQLASGLVNCFAMVNLYHAQKHSASLILHTLREGDELTFNFYPDAHTNGYLTRAGLHGDALYLHVRRKGKVVARWELDSSICPSNSARMVRGIPDKDELAA